MANYFERISVLIDVKAERAASALGKFKETVSQAEGITGKAKAAVKGLGDAFKGVTSSPMAMAGAAGAATAAVTKLGEAVWNLADDYAQSVLEVDNFGKAVGLSIEEASKWVAAGEDVGLTAGDMQAAFVKLTKSLETTPFEKYGIHTKTASGAQKSMNEILVDTLGTIGAIVDPTARATAGTDLLGKSYATLAPLIGKSRTEIQQWLASANPSEIFTKADVKNATAVQNVKNQAKDIADHSKRTLGTIAAAWAVGVWNDPRNPLKAADAVISWFDDTEEKAHQLELEQQALARAAKGNAYADELAAKALNAKVDVMKQHTADVERDAAAVENLRQKTKALLDERLRELDATQSVERAHLQESRAIDGATQAVTDANKVLHDGTKTALERADALRQVRTAQLDAASAILDAAKAEATQKGYAEGSNDALREEIGYLEKQAEKFPSLKKDIEAYIAALKNIPGYIETKVAYTAPDFGRGGGPGGNSITAGTTFNITVNGALDANSVARQIDTMLRKLYSQGGGLGVSIYGGRK